MQRRTIRPATRRRVARWVHLIAALGLGAFIYAPAEYVESLRLALQIVAVPAATITGVYLWKQAAIHRLLRRSKRDSASSHGLNAR